MLYCLEYPASEPLQSTDTDSREANRRLCESALRHRGSFSSATNPHLAEYSEEQAELVSSAIDIF